MKYSIVLSTQQTKFAAVAFEGGAVENIRLAARMGYRGVELAVRDGSLVDPAVLRRAAGDAGLDIPAIGTGQLWGEEGLSLSSEEEESRETAVARIHRHIDLAAELGSVVIIGLVRGVRPSRVEPEVAEAWMRDNLARLADYASKRGVRIAVEAINRYETDFVNSVEEALRLIDAVGSPSLGILLDTFHMNIEEPDICESIAKVGDRLFHFHVADSNRWYPGAGHIDFGAILAALEAQGYEGYVSGEYLPRPDAETSIKRGLEHLKRCEARGADGMSNKRKSPKLNSER